jgi:hypothetical protein
MRARARPVASWCTPTKIRLAHADADHARCDHHDVEIGAGPDQIEGDVVSRGEIDERPGAQVRRHVLRPDGGHDLVGDEQHHGVRARARVRDRKHLEPVALRLFERSVADVADHHAQAGIAQVQGLRAALVAVADHRDRLARERSEIGIFVVIDRRHAPSAGCL